jgi:hypothetical protein
MFPITINNIKITIIYYSKTILKYQKALRHVLKKNADLMCSYVGN